MKDRIQKLLLQEKLSPIKFAEIIGVQRSSISHILSGRNNPSFDLIHSILEKFPNINPDWLIMGKGDLYRKPIQTSIFDLQETSINEKNIVNQTVDKMNRRIEQHQHVGVPISKAFENSINEKQIERVVVFYKDKTFSEYRPEILH
jgi:transcriptional regulator with XRE-family HTH domain